MKETVKIYSMIMYYVNLIVGIICCITIVGAIIGVPMIMGANKFKEVEGADNAKLIAMKSALLGWGIFFAIIWAGTIIGCLAVIAGTIVTNEYIKKLQTEPEDSRSLKEGVLDVFHAEPKADTKAKLEELKKMLNDGTITQDEYDAMRKKVLGI